MSATAQDYFTAFLRGLGLPVTQANLNALYGVAQLEGWNDRYNPLNVIQPEPGSTNYNNLGGGTGVQTYADFASGVKGAVELFSGSHWAGVRQALAQGNNAQNVLNAFKAAYTWDPNVQFPMGSPDWGTKVVGPGAATGYNPAEQGATLLTSSGAPSLSDADYSNALGNLSGLLQTVPELKGILQQAIAGGWAVTKFQQAVEGSNWYRQHNDSTKQLVALQASDPAEYATRVANAQQQVANLAHQLGVSLNHVQIGALAQQFMAQGWDNQTLVNKVGGSFNVHTAAGALSGQAAQLYQQLRQTYTEYGVPLSDLSTRQRVASILAGNATLDTFKQNAVTSAKSMFPSLAPQIDAGMTVEQIADPYRQTMASTLEIDPNAIALSDPTLQKALQGSVVTTNGKATATTTPLYQFQQQLRNDPRWAQTQNAKDTISTALLHVGRDFGFGGL